MRAAEHSDLTMKETLSQILYLGNYLHNSAAANSHKITKLLLEAKMRKQAGFIVDLSTDYFLLDKEVESHLARNGVIKTIKREVFMWHRCGSFCSSLAAPDMWSFLAIHH